MTPKYSIGTKYYTQGKYPILSTVVDIHTTFDSKMSFVKLSYVSTHSFMGQTVTKYDVSETTITRGLIK